MRFSGVTLVCALMGVALVGCGQKTESSNVAPSTAQQPEAKQSTEAAGSGLTAEQEKTNAAFPESALKSLPEAVIVRVPVDANGKELSNMSEMRLHSGAAVSKTDSDAVAGAFAKGSTPSLAKSELDKDSSTQSWWWNRGCNNWYSYRPYYNYYGSSYYYTQPTYYGYGNYNYYYYQNYNSCGYGRGYGYGY